MRCKGSCFTLGVWGWGCVRYRRVATVRNRPQVSASIRVRAVWPCLWGVLQNWSLLEVSDVVSPRFAWQAWHFVTFQHVFHNASKVVFCDRRNTFASFSEDELHFSWQAQHFGHLQRHFRRVLFRVFCESHLQGCVKWWQRANSVAGLRCAENWPGHRTKHRFWGIL